MRIASSTSLVLVATSLVACPADVVTTTDEPGTSTGDEGTTTGGPEPTTTGTADPGTSTEPDTGTTDEPTTDTGTAPMPDPICGNGFVEGDEPCDDANDDPDDGCNVLCERTGVPLWTVSWDSGSKKDDTANAVALDADGDIYVAGSIEGDDNLSDAVVRKLDPDGNEVQQFVYAGQLGLDDFSYAIALDDAGSVYLGGSEQIVADGQYQGFLRKYDADGETVWTYTQVSMFLEGDTRIGAVAVRGDVIYVAGISEVEDDVFEMFVHRLDPVDGTPVWTKSYLNGSGLQGVAIDPADDTLVLAAQFRDAFNKPARPVLARFSPDGDELLLSESLSDGDPALLRGVAIGADGTLYVTGVRFGEATGDDVWSLALDPAGEPLWAQLYDRGQQDVGTSIALSPAGEVYVGGLVYESAEQSNVFVGRYTAAGEQYWTSLYNNDDLDLYDEVSGIAVNDTMVVAVGSSNVLGHGKNQWIRAYQP